MANIYWLGHLAAIAQVDTITPGGTIGTETFTCTINGKSITYTASGGDTVADVVDGLVAAWNASTEPEFAEITATDSTTHMTLTMDDAHKGKPFTVTSSATGAATNVQATTTANSGPNCYLAGNFSGGSVPGAADTLIVADTNVSILYDLDQSGAGTLTEIIVAQSFTGRIGLPRENTDGDQSYAEYRPAYLKINSGILTIGEGAGTGSGRLKFDLDGGSTTLVAWNSGSPAETDRHAIQIHNATLAATQYGGTIDVAPEPDQSCTVTTLTATAGQIRVGDGGTLTTLTLQGNAAMDSLAQPTTLTLRETASAILRGGGTITTLSNYGRLVEIYGTATATNLDVGRESTLDTSRAVALTVTNAADISAGATINDPASKITWSNGYVVRGGGAQHVRHTTGEGVTVTVS